MTEVGYRKPPFSTRFRKGESGNPNGRPKGRRNEPPYEAVLGRPLKIRDGGVQRTVTAAEAFLLQLTKRAIEEGDVAARSALGEAIERARGRQGAESAMPTCIVRTLMNPNSVAPAILPLRMAKKLDPYRPTAKVLLEPWIVEAALARLAPNSLTPEQQAVVVDAVRTPHKVKWPAWWSYAPPPQLDRDRQREGRRTPIPTLPVLLRSNPDD
jgi:hypothetical protein